jgi:carboxyl-terminal processing protease
MWMGLIGLVAAGSAGIAVAAGPQSPPAGTANQTAPVPVPAMAPDVARHVQEITDVVLENHVDPPARQQMILSGIKVLYRVAGVPVPPGLGRRVSAITTPEQLAAFLEEVWPRTTAKPIAANEIEEALLEGLLAVVPGRANLMTAKESKVAEQFAGNRYVGIHIALGMDDKAKQPMMHDVFPGGPADRAGVKKGDLLEEVDGVDTKGVKLRDVVERLRGEEGTEVTIKVRDPKETKSRTMTLTRGQLPRTTIEGVRKHTSGDWKLRLDVPDPIGYLKITEITASTPHELRKLARQMESEGIRALVLDLRGLGSGGTAVHPAVLLADSLLERGPIGRVRTTRGETTYQADADALFRGWPIAVLVDQTTSGTAEWLAAALQDNHRAVVVGSPTMGAHWVVTGGGPMEHAGPRTDAIVNSTIPVGDGHWSVSLTTGYLERGDGRPLVDHVGALLGDPSGRERTGGGIQPDHPLPASRGRVQRTRTPAEKADAYQPVEKADMSQPADKADRSIDQPLNAAVTILHEALAKP